jgi:hypothetical protein
MIYFGSPLLNPQVGRSTPTGSFFSPWPEELSKWLFYFPFGKSAPTTQLQEIPPLYLGRSDFAPSRIRWSSALSPISETRKQSTLTLPLSSFGFSLSRFRRSRCQATCSRDSRNPIFQNSDALTRLTFQCPFTSVGTSDFAISRILMQ